MTKNASCPLCGAPASPEHQPFCSRGCKDRDLLNWLGEGYRLPGTPVDPTDTISSQTGLDTPSPRD